MIDPDEEEERKRRKRRYNIWQLHKGDLAGFKWYMRKQGFSCAHPNSRNPSYVCRITEMGVEKPKTSMVYSRKYLDYLTIGPELVPWVKDFNKERARQGHPRKQQELGL